MASHTGRLIATIIFMIFAVLSLVSGYWFSTLFWTLFVIAVGHPFVRGGRINLNYDDTPRQVVTIYEMGPRPTAPGSVMSA